MFDDWPDEAGRATYLAGLHASQALIVERTGKAPLTNAPGATEQGIPSRSSTGIVGCSASWLG